MSQPQDQIQESWEDDLEQHELARKRANDYYDRLNQDEEPFTPADIGMGLIVVLGIVGLLYALDWCAEVIRAARVLAS